MKTTKIKLLFIFFYSFLHLSVSATSLSVGVGDTTAKTNHPGINIGGAGGTDYNPDKPWADAMRSHRNTYFNAPKDSNYWLTQDGQYLVWSGFKTDNNNGTYTLYFTGQATVTTGNGTVSNQAYNASTNISTAKIVVTDPKNSEMWINFTNTKRTASSATNTGVTNIQLMRPTFAGSTTSYPQTQIFTDQFIESLAPFEALRFMDWTATNACGDSLWSDRTLWRHASQKPPSVPNRTYGWQGRGASWESVILLCNQTGKDAWINIPHKCTDDYITKLAQLFKYGSDGVNPYTSVQSNPVFPPLNSNLHLYVEYSNEIWNWGSAFSQTPWCRKRGLTHGMPLNFDGETNDMTLLCRFKAMRSVQISDIFRNVFGDTSMMTQVRPVLEWQQSYNDLTARTLNFIDRWYNKRDSRSSVSTPHPVNYYIYGGGGSTYWQPNSPTVTLDNIWTTGYMVASTWETSTIRNDANWTAAYGIKQCAYEGGAIEEYDIPDSIKQLASADPRMQNNYIEHQKAWNHVGGSLNMYFNLSSGKATPELAILCTTDKLNTSKWYAIQSMLTTTTDNVTANHTAPFTRPGGSFDVLTYEAPKPTGTGTLTLTANSSGYAAGYSFIVPSDGYYSVQIQYSSTVAADLAVDFGGNTVGNFSLASTNGATKNTPYMNIYCTTNKLYGIRCLALSGKISIVKVVVESDIQAPSIPASLSSSNITTTGFTLSWAASTDNVGVESYEVFRGTTSCGISTSTTLNVTGLASGTVYPMTVVAKDAAGNVSAASTVLDVTTATAADIQTPSIPASLSSSNISTTGFTLSWTASTDNIGVTGYEVFKDGVSLGTTTATSMNVSGLTANTTYAMTVRASDAIPNWSAQSAALNVTTSDIPNSINNPSANNVTVYPNPANDIIYIYADDIIQSLVITDVTGKIVLIKDDINDATSVQNIGAFSKGYYLITVKTKSGLNKTSRFIKK